MVKLFLVNDYSLPGQPHIRFAGRSKPDRFPVASWSNLIRVRQRLGRVTIESNNLETGLDRWLKIGSVPVLAQEPV